MKSEQYSGDYISHGKNCTECYIMQPGCEDCKYVLNGFPGLKDSYDCIYVGAHSTLMYEMTDSGMNETMVFFGNLCLNGSSYLQYCSTVMSSKNCFGCSNMKNKQYCILNKQYTKEEYEKFIPRIIEHMKETGEYGEFFPAEISPFTYEESCAASFFSKK